VLFEVIRASMQRALARARGFDETRHLAENDGEVDAPENLDARVGLIDFPRFDIGSA
jgi:hypothetical protein